MSSTSRSSALRSNSGFTLLEVLIAICILAFISIGIYRAITETYRLRATLSTEGDFYNGIRLSMNILQEDITMLYSPLPMVPGWPSPSPSPSFMVVPPGGYGAPAQVPDPTLAQTFEYWGPALDASGLRPSHFIGTESKLTFVANSHLRVYKDSQESEFAAIAYDLVADNRDHDSQMLVKTESTDVFNLDPDRKDPNQRVFALLHGIKKFKYRYYRKDKDEWDPKWDSDSDDQKNIYPDIVELTIEVTGPNHMVFDGKFLFRPELPLRALNPSI